MALDGLLKTSIARGWMLGSRSLHLRPTLTILYYHAVPDEFSASFARQMNILASEADVVFADHPGAPVNDKPLVAITFDDAFESVARNALPILSALKLPTTIFAPSGWLGQRAGWSMESIHDQGERVMTAEALRTIQSPLVRIGSHSVDHIRMAEISADELHRQALASRQHLEDFCGKAVDEFAFPYGSLNQAALDAVAAAGYRQAYSVMPQRIAPGLTGLLRGRTSTEPSDSAELFRLKFNGAFSWLPMASKLKRIVLGEH